MIFFRHFAVTKKGSLCLLSGSLAYIFCELLIWMQLVKLFVEGMCLRNEIYCIPRVRKPSLNSVNFVRKKKDSPGKLCTSFSLVTPKCCCLPGNIEKAQKVRTIDEIPAIFQTWSLAGTQSKLAHAY